MSRKGNLERAAAAPPLRAEISAPKRAVLADLFGEQPARGRCSCGRTGGGEAEAPRRPAAMAAMDAAVCEARSRADGSRHRS